MKKTITAASAAQLEFINDERSEKQINKIEVRRKKGSKKWSIWVVFSWKI